MQNMILCLLQTNNQMMKIKSQPLDQLKVVYMRLDILPRWDVSSEWDPFYPAFTREKLFLKWITLSHVIITMKPLNSGHLQVLKNLTVIERCPLLRGNLKKTHIWDNCLVRYSRDVRYLGCSLLGGFTV